MQHVWKVISFGFLESVFLELFLVLTSLSQSGVSKVPWTQTNKTSFFLRKTVIKIDLLTRKLLSSWY